MRIAVITWAQTSSWAIIKLFPSQRCYPNSQQQATNLCLTLWPKYLTCKQENENYLLPFVKAALTISVAFHEHTNTTSNQIICKRISKWAPLSGSERNVAERCKTRRHGWKRTQFLPHYVSQIIGRHSSRCWVLLALVWLNRIWMALCFYSWPFHKASAPLSAISLQENKS